MSGSKPRRVGVVGSGISGLSSALLLQKGGAEVTLYESEPTFGGHTLTDETIKGVPVDLGFQVFNRTTYGHFEQFLEMLGVDSEESDMSFALSVDGGKLEWGSHTLATVFAQKKNWFSPSFWGMVRDVVRFGKEAPKVLEDDKYRNMNLGQYLEETKYSKYFIYNYLLPMCAAVWSVSNKQCLEFPIQVLIRFWVNHHLLDLLVRPKWRVVKNRSRTYVKAVIDQLKDARTSAAVTSVVREGGKVTITDAKKRTEVFDDVVFATHSDITLKILGSGATKEEREVLEGVPYSHNEVYLHRDPALMPKNRKVWASWNCLDFSHLNKAGASDRAVCVSYYVNSLQRIPEHAGDLFVTLNPPHPPAADKIVRKLNLSHPMFSFASVKAQEMLPSIQGKKKAWFCGAWCGYGFHEDGIKAAVAVVEGMGYTVPWTPRPTSPHVPLLHSLYIAGVNRMAKGAVQKGSMRVIMPSGEEVVYGRPLAEGEEEKGPKKRGPQAAPIHTRVKVYNTDFFARVARDTDIGLGESYMFGDYEPDDLTNFIGVLTQNIQAMNASQGKMGIVNWIGTKMQAMAHFARANTIEGSRKNINEHYDLGNDMYKLFLDETWMYSSGVFNSPEDSLYQSQLNKLDLIIKKCELKPTDHVLEIGCGWGGFAVRAVKSSGCKLTGITISEEQYAFCQERIKKEGLEDRITVLFCDYRKMDHLAHSFDKLVSIEMIEAVGHENLGEYFSIIDQMLKPGGKAVIQAITYKDEYYKNYCNCSDFIRRHIFPGGHLPSMGTMLGICKNTNLSCYHVEDIGLDYATTLKLWHENWCAREKEIKALGHDDVFFRKWRFYFSYCEAGFEQGFIHNYQIVWAKSPVPAPAEVVPTSFSVPTNTMLMMWCFLSGLVAGKYIAFLWMLPLFAVTFLVLSMISSSVSPRLFSSVFSKLDAEGRTMWHSSVVGLVFSAASSSLLVSGIVNGSFEKLFRSEESQLCNTLLSVCCGYCVWALFDGISAGSRSRMPSEIVRNTIALCVASVCLAKQLLVPYVCLAFISEVHSFFMHLQDCSILCGGKSRVLSGLQWAALLVARIGGHVALTAHIISDSTVFPHPYLFWVALVGMLSLNVLNVRLGVDLFTFGPPASRVVHATHTKTD